MVARCGLTLEEYVDILRLQGGVCAVCKRSPKAHQVSLAVDHDHKTGLIRGLLCRRCNFDLFGVMGEAPEFYEAAAAYLRTNPAPFAIGYRYVPDSPGAEGIHP